MTQFNYFVSLLAFVCIVASSASAQSDDTIAGRFQTLTRDARWTEVSETKLQFDAHHPQGMTIIDDRVYLSSVEVINRARGEGRGHVFEIAPDGKLLRSVTLGEGPAYHPGGMDFDGKHLWVAVAEYRPDSSSVVYTVGPQTMIAEKVFTFDDHLGALVHDRESQQLIGASWGSRKLYRWSMDYSGENPRPESPAEPNMTPNPTHYIDYQDMQVLTGGTILCSGLAGARDSRNGTAIRIGGVDLVDAKTLRPIHQLPVPLWTDAGKPYTQNPFHVQAVRENALRFHFLPEDGHGTIYVLDAQPR